MRFHTRLVVFAMLGLAAQVVAVSFVGADAFDITMMGVQVICLLLAILWRRSVRRKVQRYEMVLSERKN